MRVFGSVATGEATETSDVDFLVSTHGQTSPWFPVGFAEELEALLGRRVPLPVVHVEVFPPPNLSEEEEDRMDLALAARAAKVFEDTGLYIVCAVLDPTAR